MLIEPLDGLSLQPVLCTTRPALSWNRMCWSHSCRTLWELKAISVGACHALLGPISCWQALFCLQSPDSMSLLPLITAGWSRCDPEVCLAQPSARQNFIYTWSCRSVNVFLLFHTSLTSWKRSESSNWNKTFVKTCLEGVNDAFFQNILAHKSVANSWTNVEAHEF